MRRTKKQMQPQQEDEPLPWDGFLVNMDKLVLSLASWLCIIPASVGYEQCNYLVALVVALGGLCSALHHAVEERFGFPAFHHIESERVRWATLQLVRVFAVTSALQNLRWWVLKDYGPAVLIVVGLVICAECAAVEPYFSPHQRRMWRFVLSLTHQVSAAVLLTVILERNDYCPP